ncbi:MAG: TM2 domain-containing protein [Synechococcus sp.]
MSYPDSKSTSIQPLQRRNLVTAYALWFLTFFGINGAHRFYLGKNITGGVWLCTFGCFFIGQLIDLFLIPEMVNDYNLRLEGLAARGSAQQWPIYRPAPSEPLKGQPLMRRLIQMAARRQGVLSVTAAIAEIEEADFDDIEEAFRELERRGYAHIENDLVTGAVQYRFMELEEETHSTQ